MEGFNRGGGFRGGGRGGGFGGGFRGGGGFRRRFNDGPREMHKATCTDCGKECEVPFKPTEGKPVLCKECYFKKKGITPRAPRTDAPKQAEEAQGGDDFESSQTDGE